MSGYHFGLIAEPKPMKQWADFNEDEGLEYYRSVNNCPSIEVVNQDSIETSGWSIYIHEDGRASKIKGKVVFTPFQWRQLIRRIVEDGEDIEDWSAVDLSWVVEND